MNTQDKQRIIKECEAALKQDPGFDNWYQIDIKDKGLSLYLTPSGEYNAIHGAGGIFAVLNAYRIAYGMGIYITTKDEEPVIRAFFMEY